MKVITLNATLLAGGLALAACAARASGIKPGVDLSKIRKVSVSSFDGAGGREVADEFVRQLLSAGLEVTDGQHPGDAILKGTVTNYMPARTLMVFLGKTTVLVPGGAPVTENNPILSPGAAQAVPESTAAGASNAQIASVSAEVSVAARLTDFSSGATLWSGSYSYEAFDMPAAVHAVIGVLTQSLGQALPQMNKRPQ